MPKKWIYTKRGKTQLYPETSLEEAVKAVNDGMSIRKAAVAYNIPKSTIGDRISGKHEIHVPNGRPPHIPREVEDKIVGAVKMAARRGIGLTRNQILSKTYILSKRIKVAGGYPNFKAGKSWWEGLKRRHPDLVIRKPERLTATRARMMNREVINKYFDDLGCIIEELNLSDKPMQIWNCDEMAKNFEHDPVRVVAGKGENCLSKTCNKSSNITVMACVNAAGQRMPPMFIAKGKTQRSLLGFNVSAAPPGSRWFYQENGWMNDEIGEHWFNDIFLSNCGETRPQLLILDGHSSHETLSILLRAIEENIHILFLPPHTTHHLQPLDKAVFGPLNRCYNKVCSEFLQENPLHLINKWTFPALLRTAWDSAVSFQNITSGFRACGIYPLNSNILDDKVFAPSDPTDAPCLSQQASVPMETAQFPLTIPCPLPPFESRPTAAPGPPASFEIDVPYKISPLKVSSDPMISGTSICETNDTSSFHVITETPSADHSSVVDLSDPSVLFNIVNDINFIASPIVDENGHPVRVLSEDQIRHDSPNNTLQYLSEDSSSIDSIITKTFVPPCTDKPKPKGRVNRVTKHRLLTSDDIIAEKIRARDLKEKKNKKKTIVS